MKDENIRRYTIEEIEAMIARGEDRTDWARVRAMTDEEIEAAIKDDPDEEGFDDENSEWVWVVPRTKANLDKAG